MVEDLDAAPRTVAQNRGGLGESSYSTRQGNQAGIKELKQDRGLKPKGRV